MKKLSAAVIAIVLVSSFPVHAQVNLGTSASVTNPQRSSDATTGLFSSTTGAVSVSSAGTEIVHINGTGMGIGTATPGYNLDVNNNTNVSQLHLTGNNSDDGAYILGYVAGEYLSGDGAFNGTQWIAKSATGASLIAVSFNGIAFYANTGLTVGSSYVPNEVMYMAPSGNVGIGTASPSNMLSLDGTAARTFWMERGSAAGNNLTVQAGGGLSGGSNESGGNLILSPGITTGTGTSNILFNTYPAGSSGTSDNTALTALTLSATGTSGSNANTTIQPNAGSGTNKNGGTLTLASGVSTGTGTSAINFNVYPAGSSGSSNNTVLPALTLSASGASGSTAVTTLQANPGSGTNQNGGTLTLSSGVSTGTGTSAIYFNLYPPGSSGSSANTPITGLTILANNSPSACLHGCIGINTTGPENPLEIDQIGATGSYGLLIVSPAGGNIRVWDDNTNARISGNLNEDTNIALNGSGTGLVGIHTTSPSFTLHVNGSVAGTSAYNNLSDIRVKKDVEPIGYGLDAVMKLRPIGFNWKDQNEKWKKQHQIGLIAQEVEGVVPEVVTTANDPMQSKNIAYGSLVPVLIKAVQEQQDEIDRLKKTIEHMAKQK